MNAWLKRWCKGLVFGSLESLQVQSWRLQDGQVALDGEFAGANLKVAPLNLVTHWIITTPGCDSKTSLGLSLVQPASAVASMTFKFRGMSGNWNCTTFRIPFTPPYMISTIWPSWASEKPLRRSPSFTPSWQSSPLFQCHWSKSKNGRFAFKVQ